MAKATIESDSDGWWAYYAPGWKSADDPVGIQHQDHADTKREIMALVRDAIACDCADCKAKQKPSPMTIARAKEKAREKWGPIVHLWSEKCGHHPKTRCIGRNRKGLTTYFGTGDTWEQAFADADRREAKAKIKYG